MASSLKFGANLIAISLQLPEDMIVQVDVADTGGCLRLTLIELSNLDGEIPGPGL